MRLRDVVVLRAVIEAGPDDRVFDAMLLCGPLVLLIIAVAGRSTVAVGAALLYLAAFVAYVLVKAARGGRS